MARAGVTYQDVVKAAASLQTQGKDPTVDRVRAVIGTGSKSTLGPLLKRWREEHDNDMSKNNLPPGLFNTVKDLHSSIQQIADERILAMTTQLDEERASLNKLLEEVRAELRNANMENLALQARANDLEKLSQEQEATLSANQLSLTKSETEREAIIEANKQLKQDVAELKKENHQVREHFEHYQNSIAEARQRDSDQALQTQQQLQGKIQAAQDELNANTVTIASLRASQTHLDEQKAMLNNDNNRLQAALDESNEALKAITTELTISTTLQENVQAENKQLKQSLSESMTKQLALDKKVVLTTQASDLQKTAYEESLLKMSAIEIENKKLLQEMAILNWKYEQMAETHQDQAKADKS